MWRWAVRRKSIGDEEWGRMNNGTTVRAGVNGSYLDVGPATTMDRSSYLAQHVRRLVCFGKFLSFFEALFETLMVANLLYPDILSNLPPPNHRSPLICGAIVHKLGRSLEPSLESKTKGIRFRQANTNHTALNSAERRE
jgi:hypothetical protein